MQRTDSPPRQALLRQLADDVVAVPGNPYVRVGVDGVDGAGKSLFAGELTTALRRRGRAVVHASLDGFHRPRALRHARGAGDSEGFYRDSYDLAAFQDELLDPFAPGGHGLPRTRVPAARTDSPDVTDQEQASPGTILVVDGILLRRPELRGHQSWSLWLDVERATTLQRCVLRDGSGSPDPADDSNRRNVEGQEFHLRGSAPQQRATHVVDDNDLARPVLLR